MFPLHLSWCHYDMSCTYCMYYDVIITCIMMSLLHVYDVIITSSYSGNKSSPNSTSSNSSSGGGLGWADVLGLSGNWPNGSE